MNLLLTISPVTLHGSMAIMDDVETGLRVLDESFRVSLIFGGALVALLAVLALAPYVSVLVAEFRKVRH